MIRTDGFSSAIFEAAAVAVEEARDCVVARWSLERAVAGHGFELAAAFHPPLRSYFFIRVWKKNSVAKGGS